MGCHCLSHGDGSISEGLRMFNRNVLQGDLEDLKRQQLKKTPIMDLTLRDYFASDAMQAIVRRYDGHSFGGGINSPQYKELAEDAYNIADAMLAARASNS